MKNLRALIIVILICNLNSHAQDMFIYRKLTSDSAREGFPAWSPGGDSLVYQLTNLNDSTGKNGLWKVSQDGTGAKQIFCGIAEHPKWSPDGRYIVFDSDTGRNIKFIPAAGGEPVAFLPDSIHIMNGGLPCWSPDATQIAFIEGATLSLCIYNFKTGNLVRIFSKDGMVPLPGCWTNDGKYILTALMDRQTRKSTLWKISPDGKERNQITGHHENFYRHLALSPDDSFIVYAALENDYLGLYIMPANGGISIPLSVTSNGHNEGPAWSPDGKKIAFCGTRSWNADIWIVDVDMEQLKKKFQQQDR